ncbi:MAG: hypothetical protein IPG04_10440 [Polyangiaceae bacterium]|nr:hypothetical protein [Polyangiaceae bacterium]
MKTRAARVEVHRRRRTAYGAEFVAALRRQFQASVDRGFGEKNLLRERFHRAIMTARASLAQRAQEDET